MTESVFLKLGIFGVRDRHVIPFRIGLDDFRSRRVGDVKMGARIPVPVQVVTGDPHEAAVVLP